MSFVAFEEGDFINAQSAIRASGGRMIKLSHNAAVKRTLAQLGTRTNREIRDKTGIPKKVLDKRIKISKRKIPTHYFIGTNPVGANFLNPKQKFKRKNKVKSKAGITYKGLGRARVTAEKAFFGKSGIDSTVRVYERVNNAPRLPIKEVTVPIHETAKTVVNRLLRSFAPAKYKERFEHEYNRRVTMTLRRMRMRTSK